MPPGEEVAAHRVTWDQVHAFRMAGHHLDRPAPRSRLPEVVADACGIQAQVMAAAQLALRVRLRGLTLADVEQALWRDRSIARVWSLRGTVHVVPSKEFAVFVRGPGSRQVARFDAWLSRSGADPEAVERLIRAATSCMERPRTRTELADRVHTSLGWPIEHKGSRGWGSPRDVAGFRLDRSVITMADVAWVASYRALACFGPDNGDGSTFVRPDAWIPGFRDTPVEDAEAALLRRYLHAYGPATAQDFAAWSVVTVAQAKQIWSRVEKELAPVSLDGRVVGILRRDLPVLQRAKLRRRTVRLLPYFDSFLMGHKGRGHLVDAAHYRRIYRPAGWVYPAVLVDGRVAGEWSYERRAGRLRVRIQPYEPLDADTRDGVRREAEDVARFLETGEVRVSFARPR